MSGNTTEPHPPAPGESLDELFRRLGTSQNGLSSAEAANPLVIILLIAGIASAALGETTGATIIGAIVLMSTGFNGWQAFRC